MASALCLYEDNRIHSAWKVLPNGNYSGMPIVDTLPEGNLPDYRYIDGEYVYDPLPEPEQPEPAPSIESRVETVETKTAELEESLEMLLSGVTSDE